MAEKSNPPAQAMSNPPLLPPPTVHEAELESGLSGAILRGPELDLEAAVARRQAGNDVVVCGSDLVANRKLALQIEAAVGPASKPQWPHKRAGPMALPHFHQRSRTPEGHTFYETDKRKAKKP